MVINLVVRSNCYEYDLVVIDGSKEIIEEDTALIDIRNSSYIQLSGLILRKLVSEDESVPVGILVSGNSSDVKISSMEIYGIVSRGKANDRNAHGIAVFGDNLKEIKNIEITENKIYNNILGSSEALAINGNVENYIISNNEVFNNDNIGIDVIAHEGVCKKKLLDSPRNGRIIGNSVHHNRTDDNPSYYGDKSCAGIYIDGSNGNIIENNKVFHNNYGIEIGIENSGYDVYGNTVSGNSVFYNDIAGILIGGYKENLGFAKKNRINNNLIYHNQLKSKDGGEVILHKSSKNIFEENTITKKNESGYKYIEYWIDRKYVVDNIFINNDWK